MQVVIEEAQPGNYSVTITAAAGNDDDEPQAYSLVVRVTVHYNSLFLSVRVATTLQPPLQNCGTRLQSGQHEEQVKEAEGNQGKGNVARGRWD